MGCCIILIVLVVVAVLLAAGGIVYSRFQKIKRDRNRSILRHIREQERITKELERILVEKNALERLLKIKLDGSDQSQDDSTNVTDTGSMNHKV